MKICSLILGSVLTICSVLAYDWEDPVHEGRLEEVKVGESAKVPGLCWACKWVLKKVKKSISNGTTPDEIKRKLRAACEQVGFLRSACKGFVKRHLNDLVEELSTTDDVKTICVSLKACKPKELVYM